MEQKQAIRNTPSAAELASADAEGYAEPGLAEHKSAGGKHLDEYWHRGSAGLRPEGHDVQEEEQRLHELEEVRAGCVGALRGGIRTGANGGRNVRHNGMPAVPASLPHGTPVTLPCPLPCSTPPPALCSASRTLWPPPCRHELDRALGR